MKNKNLLIIGAVVIAAIFFFKKKKKSVLPVGPILPGGDINLHPIDMLPINNKATYPGGITEGMRVMADYGDGTQYIIEEGKKWGLTYDQWAQRGFDGYTTISSSILDQIPDGGIYNSGI